MEEDEGWLLLQPPFGWPVSSEVPVAMVWAV